MFSYSGFARSNVRLTGHPNIYRCNMCTHVLPKALEEKVLEEMFRFWQAEPRVRTSNWLQSPPTFPSKALIISTGGCKYG